MFDQNHNSNENKIKIIDNVNESPTNLPKRIKLKTKLNNSMRKQLRNSLDVKQNVMSSARSQPVLES